MRNKLDILSVPDQQESVHLEFGSPSYDCLKMAVKSVAGIARQLLQIDLFSYFRGISCPLIYLLVSHFK
jgi:hypothetical protein